MDKSSCESPSFMKIDKTGSKAPSAIKSTMDESHSKAPSAMKSNAPSTMKKSKKSETPTIVVPTISTPVDCVKKGKKKRDPRKPPPPKRTNWTSRTK